MFIKERTILGNATQRFHTRASLISNLLACLESTNPNLLFGRRRRHGDNELLYYQMIIHSLSNEWEFPKNMSCRMFGANCVFPKHSIPAFMLPGSGDFRAPHYPH